MAEACAWAERVTVVRLLLAAVVGLVSAVALMVGVDWLTGVVRPGDPIGRLLTAPLIAAYLCVGLPAASVARIVGSDAGAGLDRVFWTGSRSG